eukprot:jgi/Psemu1/2146/gm1.2146_g
MGTKTKPNNNGGANNSGKQRDRDYQRQQGQRNSPSTQGTTPSSRFQGQDQTEMKGIVIDHRLDHKTPISQQFNMFYKAAKIAAGKVNPNLQKPRICSLCLMPTPHWYSRALYTKGPHAGGFPIAFLDAEKWTGNGVGDKRVKRYKEDLKKMFDIMYGQLSSGTTEKLKAKGNWTATCPKTQQAKYVEEIQMQFEVMKATGIHILSEELTRYTMKRVFPDKKYSDYAGMTEADKKPIIKAAEQILLLGMLKDEYCLKKDAYPINTSDALGMLLRRQWQARIRAAFVTNGETTNEAAQEAHQLFMNGIAEGKMLGDKLCFMQISNMEMMTEDNNSIGSADEDDSLLDNGSDSEGSIDYGIGSDESDDDWPIESNQYTSQEIKECWLPDTPKPRSENSRSEKPRSGDSGGRAEATISNKPSSY